MTEVTSNADWYTAELVMEIVVHGGRCNVVHRNLVLLHARSPEEAYEKAMYTGRKGETTYQNLKEQKVEIRFRGISKLDIVYEPPADGSEVCYEEQLDVSESEFRRMIPGKEELRAFASPNPGREHDPDYRSKAVVEEAVRMLSERKKET